MTSSKTRIVSLKNSSPNPKADFRKSLYFAVDESELRSSNRQDYVVPLLKPHTLVNLISRAAQRTVHETAETHASGGNQCKLISKKSHPIRHLISSPPSSKSLHCKTLLIEVTGRGEGV